MLYSLSSNFVPRHGTTCFASRSNSGFLSPSHPPSSLPRPQSVKLDHRPPLSLVYRRSALPQAHFPNGTPSLDLKESQRMGEFVEMELQVRDYEVDQYGVVNNAVYSSYCQHAHHEIIINKFGVDGSVYGLRHPVAVTNLSFKFLAPLKNREKFVLKVRVSHATIARIFFEHFIYKLPNYEPILEAKSTVVWLDENHRPVRIPQELKYRLMQSGLCK